MSMPFGFSDDADKKEGAKLTMKNNKMVYPFHIMIGGVPTWKYFLYFNIAFVMFALLFPVIANGIIIDEQINLILSQIPLYVGIVTVFCGIMGTTLLILYINANGGGR